MEKFYNLKVWGEEYKIKLNRSTYCYNDSLAIICYTDEQEEFAILTTCINEKPNNNCAFVDTNNCAWAEKFLQENNIATPTGRMGESGFCFYPEYKFNIDEIEELKEEEGE